MVSFSKFHPWRYCNLSSFQFNIFQLLEIWFDDASQHNHTHHEHFATVHSHTSSILWGLGHIKNAQYFVTTSEANIRKSWWDHLLNSHGDNSFSSFPDFFYTVFSWKIKCLFKQSEKSPHKRMFLSQKSNSCKISPLQGHKECHYLQKTWIKLIIPTVVHHILIQKHRVSFWVVG